MQIRRAYYATNEELSDSLSSSTIPPPPAPVCPCRKARLLQPYKPKPFMQPFRYHHIGMTFIHITRKRVRAPQAHIASPHALPSPLVVPSSPLSHPRDSVPEEIMSPQKQATSYHHHLPILIFLSHLRHIEYSIEGLVNGRVIIHRDFDRLKTELQEARTQIIGFQREQIKHDDEIVLCNTPIFTI
ncbi:hypothetical protein Tco_1222041 [Tanacetum coccineum]